jgi:hypothetical protein
MARTKSKMKTRTVAILIGIGVVVAGGGIAFAYFSSTGAGSGSATAGSAATPIVVNQLTSVSGVAPGVAPIALSGNFNNPNTGNVYVANVTATVTGSDKASACDATNFVIAGASTPKLDLPPGNGVGSWTGLTIAFNNKSTNQDGCKGAVATIAYVAS